MAKENSRELEKFRIWQNLSRDIERVERQSIEAKKRGDIDGGVALAKELSGLYELRLYGRKRTYFADDVSDQAALENALKDAKNTYEKASETIVMKELEKDKASQEKYSKKIDEVQQKREKEGILKKAVKVGFTFLIGGVIGSYHLMTVENLRTKNRELINENTQMSGLQKKLEERADKFGAARSALTQYFAVSGNKNAGEKAKKVIEDFVRAEQLIKNGNAFWKSKEYDWALNCYGSAAEHQVDKKAWSKFLFDKYADLGKEIQNCSKEKGNLAKKIKSYRQYQGEIRRIVREK